MMYDEALNLSSSDSTYHACPNKGFQSQLSQFNQGRISIRAERPYIAGKFSDKENIHQMMLQLAAIGYEIAQRKMNVIP